MNNFIDKFYFVEYNINILMAIAAWTVTCSTVVGSVSLRQTLKASGSEHRPVTKTVNTQITIIGAIPVDCLPYCENKNG